RRWTNSAWDMARKIARPTRLAKRFTRAARKPRHCCRGPRGSGAAASSAALRAAANHLETEESGPEQRKRRRFRHRHGQGIVELTIQKDGVEGIAGIPKPGD